MLSLANPLPREQTLDILIVDDDELHARSVRDLLAAHNYPAQVHTSGRAGLEALLDRESSGQPYHVLILDLDIPDLPGLEVLRALGERNVSVRTVVLSGEQTLDSVAPILKLGAFDYVRKPFVAEELINSVANALGSFQLEQANHFMRAQAEADSQLYEFLLNASPDLIYMLDENGTSAI